MRNKLFVLLGLPIFALSCIGLGGCDALDAPKIEPVYNDAGQIQVQIDSERCEDNNYETVLKKLKQAGFKNFKINFEGDIIIGLFATEDDIDSVRINGVSNFDKDSYFDTKSVVFMDVHSKKADLKLVTESIDGQLPILYSTNSFKGNDKLYAGEQLTNVGFTHVAYNPIQDCYSSSDLDYNDAEGFTVNGNSSFYDYSFFDIDANIKISYHTVTGDYCTNGLEHTFKDSPAVEPTCTESGWTSGTYCTVCNKTISGHVEIPAKGHTKVVDIEAVDATCVVEGHTEGSHCSVCNEILSVSTPTPIDPNNHVHVKVTEEAVEATCVSKGLSESSHCEDCGTIISEQHETPIDSNNHKNIVVDPAVEATQYSDGKTEGKHCGDCGKVIVAQSTTKWVPSLDWVMTNHTTTEILKRFCDANKGKLLYFFGTLYEVSLPNTYYSMKFVARSGSGTLMYAKAVDVSKVKDTSKLQQNKPPVGIHIYVTSYEPDIIYVNVVDITFY